VLKLLFTHNTNNSATETETPQESFSTFYDSYIPALYGYLIKILSDTRRVQLVIDHTLLWATNNIDHNVKSQRVFIQLLNKARNLAIDNLINSPTLIINNTSNTAKGINNPAVESFIRSLPLLEKTLAALFFYRGLTYTEIAILLQFPISLVEAKMQSISLRVQHHYNPDSSSIKNN
jgi:DNA-directed RNA polymerase specialized sigma24 family protein